MPSVTFLRAMWPSWTTSTYGVSDVAPRTASVGNVRAPAFFATIRSTDTVMSGFQVLGASGTRRRTSTLPRCGSTDGAM